MGIMASHDVRARGGEPCFNWCRENKGMDAGRLLCAGALTHRERTAYMKWNVVTDSSCDLIPSDYRSDAIELSSVPFEISVGVRGYTDNDQLDIEEMLRDMEQEKTASYTSCPAPGAWLEQFEKADRTIAITISSQLSGSMNSALTARDLALEADSDKKIAVLDSRSTGPELVLCVREIERLAREGIDFDEAVERANAFLDKTKVIFALSSFDNLIKNGRMNKMAGFLAKALGMWGIGSASDEGRIVVEGKTRGPKRTVRALIECMRECGFTGGNVAISHCDNHAVAHALKDGILSAWADSQIEILPTRGLCSYYAERGGLIVGF